MKVVRGNQIVNQVVKSEIAKAIETSKGSWAGMYVETTFGTIIHDDDINYLVVSSDMGWFMFVVSVVEEDMVIHVLVDSNNIPFYFASFESVLSFIDDMSDADKNTLRSDFYFTRMNQDTPLKIKKVTTLRLFLYLGFVLVEEIVRGSRSEKTYYHVSMRDIHIDVSKSIISSAGNTKDGKTWWENLKLRVVRIGRDSIGRISNVIYSLK